MEPLLWRQSAADWDSQSLQETTRTTGTILLLQIVIHIKVTLISSSLNFVVRYTPLLFNFVGEKLSCYVTVSRENFQYFHKTKIEGKNSMQLGRVQLKPHSRSNHSQGAHRAVNSQRAHCIHTCKIEWCVEVSGNKLNVTSKRGQ